MKDYWESREKIAGLLVIACLISLALTLVGVTLLDVKISNIVSVDRDLYVVVTDHGNVYITPDDILGVKSSFTRNANLGSVVEINKIYTSNGFIYMASTEDFSSIGRKMMSSVANKESLNRARPRVSSLSYKSKDYAIGTPTQWIPLIRLLIGVQNLTLLVCGLAIIVLVCPFPQTNRFLS